MAPLTPSRWCLALAIAAAAMLRASPSTAEPTDLAVKAAFLPRFAKYVSWPSAAMPRGDDPFKLCLVGSDPFGSMLDDAARTQSVDGHPIAVRRVESAAEANNCQIVFVSGSRASQALSAIGHKPVLTVTDAAAGRSQGIIHFVVEGGRVRFFIDQSSAIQRGLVISSRLLALALGVRQ